MKSPFVKGWESPNLESIKGIEVKLEAAKWTH